MELSTVEETQKALRLQYILQKYPLDTTQRQAFDNCTMSIVAGIHLIQGPPGTGKTRVAMVIILAFAALKLRVLLAAGSNKGVDNLAAAVHKAISADEKLKRWCGQLIRFRTPAHQIANVRIPSGSRAARERKAMLDESEQALEDIQMQNLVLRKARAEEEINADSAELLGLLRKDQNEQGLTRDSMKKLKNLYRGVSRAILQEAKVVATTLNNAATEELRMANTFDPEVLVCDESGQCLEGDHMIGLTIPSTKVVILLGDQEQLPPTVISERSGNEGVAFLQRSLMERLHDAGYPSTTLRTNYRNHPQILDFYNRAVYGGKLAASPSNSRSERVGNAWDSFTSSRHYFANTGLAGVRRLFISAFPLAEQHGNSTSWSNQGQANVVRFLLQALYTHRADNGDQVRPSDVMIIPPYKDQVKLVRECLAEKDVPYGANMTVDAAQGQEADIVIYLMTRPAKNVHSVGFVGDKRRMNVALSRARKVMVVVGNLHSWNSGVLDDLSKTQRNKFIVRFLRDVTSKCHTLSWEGAETVNETEPRFGFQGYTFHDQLKRPIVPPRPALPAPDYQREVETSPPAPERQMEEADVYTYPQENELEERAAYPPEQYHTEASVNPQVFEDEVGFEEYQMEEGAEYPVQQYQAEPAVGIPAWEEAELYYHTPDQVEADLYSPSQQFQMGNSEDLSRSQPAASRTPDYELNRPMGRLLQDEEALDDEDLADEIEIRRAELRKLEAEQEIRAIRSRARKRKGLGEEREAKRRRDN